GCSTPAGINPAARWVRRVEGTLREPAPLPGAFGRASPGPVSRSLACAARRRPAARAARRRVDRLGRWRTGCGLLRSWPVQDKPPAAWRQRRSRGDSGRGLGRVPEYNVSARPASFAGRTMVANSVAPDRNLRASFAADAAVAHASWFEGK